MPHSFPRLPLQLLLLWALTLPAQADVLQPKSGKRVEGAIVSQSDAEVVFNIYFSRNPGVTNAEHLVRLAPDKIKKLEEVPRPEVEVWRRLALASSGDAAALTAVGEYAKEHKLKHEARVCFALALAKNETHAPALKGIGGRAAFESERKGNAALDPKVADALKAYAAQEDLEQRRASLKTLADLGVEAKPYELERCRRSALEPKGLQEDRPLSWLSDQQPGAVYTLFVPPNYEPSQPWPLMIGLHGGGPDGKNGDEVVGSGPSAMNFYRELAGRRGVIVACPTALSAGWGAPENEQLVRSVLREVTLLYHVDLDRVYLTGHSMGGFGTWALAPRLCDDLAAVSPMAGGGGGNFGKLQETRTPIFIFHGADDAVVGPSSDRSAAKSLLGSDYDFVYTELDGVGHGFPSSVQAELFDFCEPRRRWVKGAKDAWPKSSFLGKVSKEERDYLGDPSDALEGRTPALSDWIDRLKRGGGGALAAGRWIAEQRPEGAGAELAKVTSNSKYAFDARAYALRALALLKDAEAAQAARKALAVEPSKSESLVATEAARTLVALGDVEGTAALLKAIDAWSVFHESKDMGGKKMRFSDWVRATQVLAELVEAVAVLAPEGTRVASVERSVVQRVLAPQYSVDTSERVPQDPSAIRRRLAAATAAVYRRLNAEAAAFTALREALSNDATAQAAVGEAR